VEALPPELTKGFEAWRYDISQLTQPLPQTEIIPLVCVWYAVVNLLEDQDTTAKGFMDSVLADPLTRTTLVGRFPEMERNLLRTHGERLVPIRRYDVPGPHSWQAAMLYQGRRSEAATLQEVSIAGHLGHALYNSTSGRNLIQFYPLGPGRDPEAWKLRGAFDNTIEYVEALEK